MLDRTTFESVFRSQFRNLTLLSLRFVKDQDAARNIVQDAFINLWEKRDTIDPSRDVNAYLSTTVRNRSLNYLRDRKKFSSDLLQIENIWPDAAYEQPLQIVSDELAGEIRRAISELPDRCREVFVLSRNEHLRYQEIADRLSISVKTVETQMSKALQHMRVRLKDFLMILLFLASGYGH